MRALFGLMFVVAFLLLKTSSSGVMRPGLLTDDFGIVTQDDVDKEAAIIQLPKSLKIPAVFPYWRCLRPDRIEMECENMGTEEPIGNQIAAPRLILVENGERYEYYTRHPWGIDACEEALSSWRRVISAETVVCVSATIDEIEKGPSGEPWKRITYGEINRIKSRVGRWSYFIDGEDVSESSVAL